ncbi:hypothetical protein [Paenibacillus macerans]|uniref:Uncharacterized protein n=1 Tax=Paenibacillus macerans TaxID=44252 RepID=A0A090Y3W7_PAEMA|nr:hypothetical protein [Paenibacillus macerans]KFM93104.1 hypothetical protein DJ90_2906 [Paenibacillus macerans]MCY7558525.1 hypothetical protein [Paenibacillus macerans]MEC0153967.1 hypothetical protein [Paenibacillus macerans]SUA84761.1 Uncharacterised protein [Paenibacillus macerans]
MARTQLEMVTELIKDLEKSIEEDIRKIEESDPSSPMVSYLNSEVERMNERLDFLKKNQSDITASGKTIYMYEFGSLNDIRQDFQNAQFSTHYIPEQLFTVISMRILQRETTPSKKIKMLDNLIKVYEEFKLEG